MSHNIEWHAVVSLLEANGSVAEHHDGRWRRGLGEPRACSPSGKHTRHRLNRGGDRQANHALWWTVITRMSSHPPARAYVERRTGEGLPGKKSSAA